MGRVEGKVTLVTGGAQGLGRAIAEVLKREGAKVTISDVAEDKGRASAEELGVDFAHHDVADEDRWRSLIGGIVDAHGGLEVLVNNAGIGEGLGAADPEGTEAATFRRVLTVNLEGTFLGCKHAIPAMSARVGGSIVNMSSIAALVATPFLTAYGASKAGVRQLTQSVALHCAQKGYGIRCNSVHPGQIITPMLEGLFADVGAVAGLTGEEIKAEFLKQIPLGEFGTPEDVANAVLYLASDESKHVTGAKLVVDGGMDLNP